MLSTEEYHKEGNKLYSRRYEHGNINEKVLESLIGDNFNAEQITVTQTDSFQCGDEFLKFLETTNEDTCSSIAFEIPILDQINTNGKTEKQFITDANGMCY